MVLIIFSEAETERLWLAQGHSDSKGWSRNVTACSVLYFFSRSSFSHYSVVSLTICGINLSASFFLFDDSLPDTLV